MHCQRCITPPLLSNLHAAVTPADICPLQEAVKQLAPFGDPSGIGAKLLSKMGFGASGGGGLGANEQVSQPLGFMPRAGSNPVVILTPHPPVDRHCLPACISLASLLP